MSAFKQFLLGEWYFAFPMLGMSLVAVALVVWRILLNRNATTDMTVFMPQLQERLSREGVEGALKFCRNYEPKEEVIPRKLFTAGLQMAKQGTAAMRRNMASTVELEIVPDLNFLLAPILAIAKIATMVGLLGTVVSMINTFNAISQSRAQGAVSYAGNIGLALFATALGLVTAIPLVFAHVLFKDWIARFEVRMKRAAQELILLVQNAKAPSASTGAKPAAAPSK